MTPLAPTTAACTACHVQPSALAHALSQTDTNLGESCDVCHGDGANSASRRCTRAKSEHGTGG